MYLEARRHELALGAREPSPSAMDPDIGWRTPKQPHLKSGGSPLSYLFQSNPLIQPKQCVQLMMSCWGAFCILITRSPLGRSSNEGYARLHRTSGVPNTCWRCGTNLPRIDFGKLAEDDEGEIHAVYDFCDAVYDFIFLETECILGDDEWNEGLAVDKNVLKRGEVSGSVRAAVKAALVFRSPSGDS